MFDTKVELIFDIDKLLNNIKDSILNFFPYDFVPKLLLALMAVVFVFGINRLYEINKIDKSKGKTTEKNM